MDTQSQRYVEAVLIIIMSFKSLYYMKLVKEVAPLIDAMSNILVDIRWFLFLFCTFMVSHAEALNSISQNQFEYFKGVNKNGFYETKILAWNIYKGHIGGLNTAGFMDVDSP